MVTLLYPFDLFDRVGDENLYTETSYDGTSEHHHPFAIGVEEIVYKREPEQCYSWLQR